MFESFLGPPPTRNSADTRSPTRREHAHTLRHAQRPNSKGGQTANRLRLLQLHARRAICRRLTAVRYNGWCWGPTDPIRYTHDRRIQPAENRNNPSPHTASNPRCLPPSVPHEVIQAGSRQLSVDRRSTNARLLVKFAPADRTALTEDAGLVALPSPRDRPLTRAPADWSRLHTCRRRVKRQTQKYRIVKTCNVSSVRLSDVSSVCGLRTKLAISK